MPMLFKPIATRFFLFMYLLGYVSSVVTIPNWKGAIMYVNAPWELFVDVYLSSVLVYMIPRRVSLWRLSVALRIIVKALIYCVIYPLYVVDTFCFIKFGSTLNPSMLLLMGETNGNEAAEFFQNYLTADVLLSEVGIILLVAMSHIVTTLVMRWVPWRMPEWRLGRVAKYAVDVAVLAGLVISICSGVYENKAMYYDTMTQKNIGGVEHTLAVTPHTTMYQPPMRLAFSIRSNQLIAQQLDNLFDTLDKAEVDSCDAKSQNIVLIIGESYNKRHSQLYGYDKATTPNQVRMERQGMLTKMNDVVAPWNLTSFVFKHLMTTYCVGDVDDWCDYPLFCQLFRKAGYQVSFLTNQFLPQAKEAVYDFSGGFFINNEKLSEAQFDIRNDKLHVFDEGLLSDWDHFKERGVYDNGKPNLTIFHLMGQHVNYRIRCPNSKKQWNGDSYPNDMDLTPKRRKMLADYDNAVWYNDSVVNQIVERYKDEDAIIIYISDHGEEVFGPGVRHFCGRMHDAVINKRLADEEFRIPMWIYCTKEYTAKHPDVANAVKKVDKKRFMTDAVSHLLMGLAGMHTKYYREEHDLLHPKYNNHRKRLLKNTVDYDELK